MNLLQRRCLIASSTFHLLLLLIVVFGSAFFVPERKEVLNTRLNVVPSRLVDAALAGGGGNPQVKPSDDREKGQTLIAKPELKPPEPKPREAKPPEPKPKPPEPKPPEPKPPEPKPPEPKAPEPQKADKPKPQKNPEPKKTDKVVLKPLSRAEARKRLASSKPSSSKAPDPAQARQLSKAIEDLRSGFADGTAVEVHGTGGAAYANYAQMIFEIYDQAWILTKEVNGEDAITKAEVIIQSSGRVQSARILRPSGNSALDATVQRALNRVKTVPPFPKESKDRERTFIINFNLKAKRLSA